MNYERIYSELIFRAKNRSPLPNEYVEEHHILPKSTHSQFKKEKWNLVKLFPEEHLIAHLLLVKINPTNEKLIHAANSMTNGFNKGNRQTNKKYAWLKQKHSKLVSENTKGNVNVIDLETGKGKQVSKEEFKLNETLVGVTKGKVNVFDKETEHYVSISTEEYYLNKSRYVGSGTNKILVWNHSMLVKEYIDKAEFNVEIHEQFVYVKDNNHNILMVKKSEFESDDKLYGVTKDRVNVVDIRNNKSKQISLDEFYSNKEFYRHRSKDKISVIIKSDGKTKQIPIDEFYENRKLYKTINENYTNVIDTRTMTKARVSIDDYKKYDYYVSNKSKHWNIYNSDDELVYKTFGNFKEICITNGLPMNALKDSIKRQSPIYMSVGNNYKMLEKKGWLQYQGWYAKEEEF